jgi:homocysteine S-methyltransferase
VLESATWRADPDWAARIGDPPETLWARNRRAIEMLVAQRDRHEAPDMPMVVRGCVGPRSDGERHDG